MVGVGIRVLHVCDRQQHVYSAIEILRGLPVHQVVRILSVARCVRSMSDILKVGCIKNEAGAF